MYDTQNRNVKCRYTTKRQLSNFKTRIYQYTKQSGESNSQNYNAHLSMIRIWN